LLGRPRIEVEGEAPPLQPRGRKSWAVLARVMLADRPLTRAELADELFELADDPLAALRWSLADLRRAMRRPDVLRGDPLRLGTADLWLDVRALEDGSLANAGVGGALLDGIEVRDCPGFDAWLLVARSHWAARSREELRIRVLRALATGDTPTALRAAERAARLDQLDEEAQELFMRALVADGRAGLAAQHLALCERTLVREGIPVSPALRAAAQERASAPPAGVRAGVAAASLLRAGTAALDAGAADGGIETLRRAAQDAARADEPGLHSEVLRALGSALVHAVRGFDGEGAVVLHRALVLARTARRPDLAADILREIAFTDVQAGRHLSASHALVEAADEGAVLDDPTLTASLLATEGMNEADLGRHEAAALLLSRSARIAASVDRPRQQLWSLGLLARSLLLAGRVGPAGEAAQASLSGARAARWNAFLPWPQAIHAECLAVVGRWNEARAEAEEAFALATELGDPCWEGMAGRVMSRLIQHDGDSDTAWSWIVDARRRCDRVPDRYVWVSSYIGLAQLELAASVDHALARTLATRLREDATRADLPEFQAWALTYQAASGDQDALGLARAVGGTVDNPLLHARIAALSAGAGAGTR